MVDVSPPASEQFLGLFGRLSKFALGQNPLQDSGVTVPQLALLDRVAALPGCHVREIADGLGLTAPTVSVAIRRLEKAGMLERQADPKDKRAVQIVLTREGQALHERAWAFRLEKMRQLLSGLTPEETAQLLALLEKAIDGAQV